MIQTIIYCIVFLLVTIFFLKGKPPALGKFLLVVYSFSSIMAIFAVGFELVDFSKVTIIGYAYLIFVCFIFFIPFLQRKKSLNSNKMRIRENKLFYYLCLFYIVCSIVTIIRFIPGIKLLVSSGDWSMNRNDLYSGEISFPYSNFVEYLMMNFTDYFRLLILIISFSSLRGEKHLLVYYLSIIGGIGSMVASSVYTSSRGTIINAGLLLIALYLFFYKQYSKNTRRIFFVAAITCIACLVPYLIVVTVSRFGDLNAGGIDSIAAYIGQSPVVFNSGVFTIDKILLGKNAFGVLFDYQYKESMIGGTWDNGFYTFVGWLFIDWGIVGTIIIGLVISFWMSCIIRKKRFYTSDVFLIFFWYNTLLSGVFVIGRSYCYSIIASTFIYLFVRFVAEANERVLCNGMLNLKELRLYALNR